ncbi:MAG: hypothetical protein ACOX1F_00950 [Erysipelotrichaceae bacterium]
MKEKKLKSYAKHIRRKREKEYFKNEFWEIQKQFREIEHKIDFSEQVIKKRLRWLP